MNVVTLVGNATRDVTLRTTPGGTNVADIGLAVNNRVKRGGQWVDEPMFIDVTVWGGLADVASKYVTKGKQIAVSGELRMDSWEKDNVKHTKHTVNCNNLQLLGSKSASSNSAADNTSQDTPSETPDDDIPF